MDMGNDILVHNDVEERRLVIYNDVHENNNAETSVIKMSGNKRDVEKTYV